MSPVSHSRLDNGAGYSPREQFTPASQIKAHNKPDWCQTLEAWVGQQPILFLSAAVIAGVTLGWYVKRK